MIFLGNLLWIILFGLLFSLAWIIVGLILCITIIGIPLGLKCFKIAGFVFAPFGKSVDISFDEHPVANIIWMIFTGWESFLGCIGIGILLCITIIGIPFAKQWFKIAKLSLMPFGADVN